MDTSREESEMERFDREFEEQKKNAARLVFSIFFFLCCLLFSVGILSNLLIPQMHHKFIVSGIFFFIVRYFSKNKLGGRVVYGGMEKPWTVSFGATLLLLGFMFMSREIECLLFSIACILLGFHFFYQGIEEGPHYGWYNHFRRRRGGN